MGSQVFKWGGTELERVLPKHQHAQRKLLNFENLCTGGREDVKKCLNLTSKVYFLYQKSSKSFSFFSVKNINLGAPANPMKITHFQIGKLFAKKSTYPK
jgi:hypothetical protein